MGIFNKVTKDSVINGQDRSAAMISLSVCDKNVHPVLCLKQTPTWYLLDNTHSRLTAFFQDYLGRPVPEG